MTAPTETAAPLPPVGLFAGIFKRAPLCDAEYAISLDQVLAEEFDQLHPGESSAVSSDGAQTESARPVESWGFKPPHVLEARLVIDRLNAAATDATPDTTGELVAVKALRAVVRLLGPHGMKALDKTDETPSDVVAREFNDRLVLSGLALDPCFQDFPLTDELRVAREQYATTQNAGL